MSKTLSSSAKNDIVFVEALLCTSEKRSLFESFGIYTGARLKIFYHDRSKIIVMIEKTKLALSVSVADEILISEKKEK